MVTDVWVGQDRILLYGYNPLSVVTMAKVYFALEVIHNTIGEIPEAEFREWLRRRAPDLAAKLDAGEKLPIADKLTIDPRSAEAETKIIQYLKREERKRRPDYDFVE